MRLKQNLLTESLLPKTVQDDLRLLELAGKVAIRKWKRHDKVKLSHFPEGHPLQETEWRLNCHVEDLGEPMRSAILAAAERTKEVVEANKLLTCEREGCSKRRQKRNMIMTRISVKEVHYYCSKGCAYEVADKKLKAKLAA